MGWCVDCRAMVTDFAGGGELGELDGEEKGRKEESHRRRIEWSERVITYWKLILGLHQSTNHVKHALINSCSVLHMYPRPVLEDLSVVVERSDCFAACSYRSIQGVMGNKRPGTISSGVDASFDHSFIQFGFIYPSASSRPVLDINSVNNNALDPSILQDSGNLLSRRMRDDGADQIERSVQSRRWTSRGNDS